MAHFKEINKNRHDNFIVFYRHALILKKLYSLFFYNRKKGDIRPPFSNSRISQWIRNESGEHPLGYRPSL